MMDHTHSQLENIVQEGIKSNSDLAVDILEITIDTLMEGIVKELPIIKSLVAFYKGSLGIREAHFIKKLLIFFKQLHSGTVSDSDLVLFSKKFDEDNDYRKKVTNHIMILNDRFIEDRKSVYFANLLGAHIKSHISYDEFIEMSLILENSQLKVFKMLSELAASDESFVDANLLQKPYSSMFLSSGLVILNNGNFGATTVNFYGVCLYYYAINGNLDMTRDQIESKTPKPWTPYDDSGSINDVRRS
jgi:hypothetical protein